MFFELGVRSDKEKDKKNVKRSVKERRFRQSFTTRKLATIFEKKISNKDNAGIDGIHAHDLDPKESIPIIRKKVIAGTYHLTPYAEIQIPKGRGKLPRIIALPTMRDQLTLSALKDYLHKTFPKAVNRKLPNSYIFELNKKIQEIKINTEAYGFIHTDITGFYDNIDREKLMNFVRSTINTPQALKLIYRAIVNPVVPRNSKRSQRFRYYTPKGVPQGLAISNVLADIYMSKFDESMEALSSYFIRYVDDILLICPMSNLSQVLERLHFEVAKLGLDLNDEKTKFGVIRKDSFNFLGYKIKSNGFVSVRESSINRKISSLAGIISSADHKKDKFLKLHNNVNKIAYKKVLIEDMSPL